MVDTVALHQPHARLLDASGKRRVEAAITTAERRTSAELRVFVCRYGWARLQAQAARLFRRHGMDRTRHRNAVLFLLVQTNRELLVHGDEGIHKRVPDGFWTTVRDTMIEHFKHDRFVDGLVAGIEAVAEPLAAHFPPDDDNPDELSNQVVHDAS